MPDIIFLTPSTVLLLTAECKAFLSNLVVEIIEEDLDRKTSGSDLYKARFRNWRAEPRPRIRRIATDGTETLQFEGTGYNLDLNAGEVDLLTTAGTDIVRADYCFAPLNDTILERLLQIAIKEVSVLIHRPINSLNILTDYQAPVCKRLYTNVLKNLMIDARNFFTITVGDRTINKEQIPAQLEAMKKSNEEDLLLEVNQLRNWNRTKRFE